MRRSFRMKRKRRGEPGKESENRPESAVRTPRESWRYGGGGTGKEKETRRGPKVDRKKPLAVLDEWRLGSQCRNEESLWGKIKLGKKSSRKKGLATPPLETQGRKNSLVVGETKNGNKAKN